MTVDYSNPAARLFHFFNNAKSISRGGTKINLAPLLRVSDSNDVTTITKRLGYLTEVAYDAERALSKIQGAPIEVITRPYPIIRDAISHWIRTLDKAWEVNMIQTVNLDILEMGADFLHMHGDEKPVDQEVLNTLSDKVQQLIKVVEESLITPELKDILSKHLNFIREAIDLYPIFGMPGIRAADEALIGALVTNADLVQAAKEESALKGVFELIKNINSLYTLTKLTLDGISFFLR